MPRRRALLPVLGTFLAMSAAVLVASLFLLHEDLSLRGCLAALATVSALLTGVISCGVAVSALCNSTVLGIAVLWVILYGGGFALTLLPAHLPSPSHALNRLPFILRGEFNIRTLGELMLWCVAGSVVVAAVGLSHFARRDI